MACRKAELAIWADIRAFPPLAVVAGLDCLAALVLWRKAAGGPPLYLTNARLCLAGLAVAALTVAGRWWLARIESESPAVWIRSVLMALAVLPMLALLSLANSQHSHWAVSFTSALAVASGGAVLLWNRISSAPSAEVPTPGTAAITLAFPMIPVTPPVSESKTPAETSPARTPPGTGAPNSEAWMERTIDESGTVKLQGQVVAEFAAGQSVATVHIPFCPPFARIPEFECDAIDAPGVRPRTPAVFRYGARVELKRAGDTSHPARAKVRFHACASADASRAA
ncbi:MAG: hypothetical protein ACM3U2_17950 [Deltaproteobacteria bacterium]